MESSEVSFSCPGCHRSLKHAVTREVLNLYERAGKKKKKNLFHLPPRKKDGGRNIVWAPLNYDPFFSFLVVSDQPPE